MRSTLLSLILIGLLALPAFAALDMQNKSFYALGTFSLPAGDFGDFAGNGFGGAVGLRVPYNESLNFRGEAGYIWFGGENFDYGAYAWDYSYSMIPIVALAEYFFTSDALFYGLGGVGFYHLRASIDVTRGETVVGFDDTVSSTEFGITLGGGYQVNEKFAVEGRYNIISDANQITINGVVSF